MPASKIVDDDEVRRWFDEGKSYPEMQQLYREKYNIETGQTMWGNYARRKKLKRRTVWDPSLIPWSVPPQHRTRLAYALLTQEARLRAGESITPNFQKRLESWKQKLAAKDLVVHYEPEVPPYFHLVPRRKGIDKDLVRVPDEVDRLLPSGD